MRKLRVRQQGVWYEIRARINNRETGRTGHIRGDRYWPRILEGEPPDRENGGKPPLIPASTTFPALQSARNIIAYKTSIPALR
ncbi:MAG: hypothetical protein LBP80_07510 [Treponema sp.]|nr:hypothetical protein [Treponema sp.]